MTSHTPGPWSLLANEVISKSGDVIADVTGGEGNRFIDDEDNAECQANAHLIAAAPDLLAALEYALEFLTANDDGEEDVVNRIASAKAAIAKAKNSSVQN
jgi:hypothetical protein